MSPKASLSVII